MPSLPRAAWGATTAWSDLVGKADDHSEGAKTPYTFGEGGGWLEFPEVGGGVAQFTGVSEADGGEAGILVSSLPRPPEVADEGRVQADAGVVLASELPVDCHDEGWPSELPAVAHVQGGAGEEPAGALPRPPEARAGSEASADEKAAQEAEFWKLYELVKSNIAKLK